MARTALVMVRFLYDIRNELVTAETGLNVSYYPYAEVRVSIDMPMIANSGTWANRQLGFSFVQPITLHRAVFEGLGSIAPLTFGNSLNGPE